MIALSNGLTIYDRTRPQIGFRSQIVLALAGLRGGTAFALALRWDGDATRIGPIESLTMGVILLTLCGAGSCVGGIIGALGLQANCTLNPHAICRCLSLLRA